MAFGHFIPPRKLMLLGALLGHLSGGRHLAFASPYHSPADKVFRNGKIHTLDAVGTTVSALAVRNGIIQQLGSDDEVSVYIGNSTTVVDLGGRVMIPGLVDSHMHVLSGGEMLLKCNLNYQPLDMTEILAHIQRCVDDEKPTKETPDSWLEVVNMDYPSLVTRSGPQTKRDLDRLATVRPVIIRSSDYHTIFANSRALEASGIVPGIPDPPGGKVERLPGTNEPSGILQDGASSLLAGPPPPTEEDSLQALRAALKLLREAGITTFQDAAAASSFAPLYSKLKASGELSARAYFDYRIEAPSSPADVPGLVASVKATINPLNDRHPVSPSPSLKWQAVKLFLDGVITYPANTAALIEPYRIPVANDTSAPWVPDPSSLRNPYWSPAILDATVEHLILSGVDAQMHADGDLAVRVALDAVERFRAKHPGKKDYRIGLAHDELSNPADWPRFRELGVDAIMSFQWAQPSSFYIPDTMRSLGPERYNHHLQAYQEIIDAGRPVVYGSDWPIDPLDEFLALKVAVTRAGDPTNPNSAAFQGPPYNGTVPGRPATRDSAIRAITNHGARFLRADASIGSLEPGKIADLAVLERDYFSVPEEELGRNKVLMTVLGGEVLYVASGATFAGVVPKFPNGGAQSRSLERRTIGGFGGKGLSEEEKQAVRRLRVRGFCAHGQGAHAHL